MLPAQGWGLAMAPVIQGDRGPKTLTARWDAVSVAMHGSPPKAGVQEGFLWEAALSRVCFQTKLRIGDVFLSRKESSKGKFWFNLFHCAV